MGISQETLPFLNVSKYTAKNIINFHLKIRTNIFPNGSFINYINKRGEGVINLSTKSGEEGSQKTIFYNVRLI